MLAVVGCRWESVDFGWLRAIVSFIRTPRIPPIDSFQHARLSVLQRRYCETSDILTLYCFTRYISYQYLGVETNDKALTNT